MQKYLPSNKSVYKLYSRKSIGSNEHICDSLRAYEGDKRVLPDNIVIKMLEIYDAQYLAYQHMKTKTQIGEEFLPELQIKSLAEAVLTFLDEREDLEKIKS